MASNEEVLTIAKWLSGDLEDQHETEARLVFARVLRSSIPLDLTLRFMLADLIDPDNDDNDHRLVLKRKPGNRAPRSNHRSIAAHVWKRIKEGDGFESAVVDAMGHFDVGRTTVTNAWAEWKHYIESYPELFTRN
jgi:hypothetical protein